MIITGCEYCWREFGPLSQLIAYPICDEEKGLTYYHARCYFESNIARPCTVIHCESPPAVHVDFTPNETFRPHSVGMLCFTHFNDYNKRIRFEAALLWLLVCKRIGYFPRDVVKLIRDKLILPPFVEAERNRLAFSLAASEIK